MPTAYCNLEDAYGSNWAKKNTQANQTSTNQESNRSTLPQLQPVKQKEIADKESNYLNTVNGSENANDIRSFCPNCKNCLNKNDALQQQIINQNISPRPRWIPQYPNAYEVYDPYNRYWSSAQEQSNREYFGNYINQAGAYNNGGAHNGVIEYFSNGSKVENLLNLILFVLVALFLIQLIEMIIKLSSKKGET